MEALEAIENRRDVRVYQDRPVHRSPLEKLLRAAVKAPSGTNSPPWAFGILQDRARPGESLGSSVGRRRT